MKSDIKLVMQPAWDCRRCLRVWILILLSICTSEAIDIYIPTLFSETGKTAITKPLIRTDEFCLGAPLPWQPFHNETTRAPDEDPDEKGPEERQGALAEKRTPLRDNYCTGVKTFERANLTAGERRLAECLRNGAAGCRHSAAKVRAAALALPGVRRLLHGPGPECYRVLSSGPCRNVDGNVETERKADFPYETAPGVDWRPRQWPTCALVGRSPLIAVARNGRAIDSHSAVWRFNLASTRGISDYAGHRTTLRLVNNADSWKASKGIAGPGEGGPLEAADGEESWLFWQYNAVGAMAKVKERLGVPVRLVSPAFIKWQMDAYYEIKRDLEELGLGPFICPTAVSSGIHGVLMASTLCEKVDLFGYSYSYNILLSRPGHNSGPQEMYPGHSWRLDAMLLRLLHLANVASVCTADDPSVPNSVLKERGGTEAREAAHGEGGGVGGGEGGEGDDGKWDDAGGRLDTDWDEHDADVGAEAEAAAAEAEAAEAAEAGKEKAAASKAAAAKKKMTGKSSSKTSSKGSKAGTKASSKSKAAASTKKRPASARGLLKQVY